MTGRRQTKGNTKYKPCSFMVVSFCCMRLRTSLISTSFQVHVLKHKLLINIYSSTPFQVSFRVQILKHI